MKVIVIMPDTLSLMYATAAPGPPTGLRAMFTGSNTITVSWTPPSGGTPPAGYIIYYEANSGGADTGSFAVGGASTSELTITGRTRDAYTVRIVALSTQLPSNVVTTTTTGGESMSIVITAYSYVRTHSLLSPHPPPPHPLPLFEGKVPVQSKFISITCPSCGPSAPAQHAAMSRSLTATCRSGTIAPPAPSLLPASMQSFLA